MTRTHPLERDLCKPRANQIFVVDDEEYTLGGKIGDGAAGLVRRAVRKKGARTRAIKLLAPDPKYIEVESFDDVAVRFRREGLRGVNLDHPNLVRIFAYCENDDGSAFEAGSPKNPFLLMEYLGGKTLESFIKNRPSEERGRFVATRTKLHLALQIASALKYLQRYRIVHRDIKPANIFLTKNDDSRRNRTVKLGDFGIVKWGDFHAAIGTGTLTMTNEKGLGTFKYMSPEQALTPKDVTVRSDIFSFGITLFELFTSEILRTSHHVYQVVNARLSRGNTTSRFHSIGFRLSVEDEGLGSLILDMHLRGATGRPTIDTVLGRLAWEYENRYDNDWTRDS